MKLKTCKIKWKVRMALTGNIYFSNVNTFTKTDMLEDVGEITEILGRSYGDSEYIDEDDLEAELACLDDEWAAEGMAEPEVADSSSSYLSSLPTQPNQQPQSTLAPTGPIQIGSQNANSITQSTSFI